MRKFLLLLFCGIVFTVAQTVYSQPPCQSGYTHKVDTLMIGGCPWEFELCFKCGLTYPGEMYIISATPIPQSPPCTVVPLQQALDYAFGQFGNWDYISNILCRTIPQAKPCPDQSTVVELYYNYCWQMEKIIYYGDETIRFTPCGDGYCKEYATYCWNGTNVVKTSIYTQSAPIECGLEEWNVVVPQNVGDKSVCFIYHSPCNP